MKRTARSILGVGLLILVLIILAGCGTKVVSPVTSEKTGALTPAAAAKMLLAGPVDTASWHAMMFFSDDQRQSLRSALRQNMNDAQLNQRPDIVAIIGPAPSDSLSISHLTNLVSGGLLESGVQSVAEYIAVGNLPQFSQNDGRWRGKKLGFSSTSTIGQYGCYLTCISMLTTFWGYSVTPDKLNDWTMFGRAHYAFQSGSDLIRTTEALQYPGLCRPWSVIAASDIENVRRQLRANHPVVVHVSWGGGHFMLLYCWDGQQFWVIDPWRTSYQLQPLTSAYGAIREYRLLGYFPR